MAGRTLYHNKVATSPYRIDLSGYAAGMYLLIVEDGKERTVKKIVIQW
jgi:hypothetical protein